MFIVHVGRLAFYGQNKPKYILIFDNDDELTTVLWGTLMCLIVWGDFTTLLDY